MATAEKPVLSKYNTSDRGKQKSRELANALYPCEVCGEQVKSHIGLYNHRRSKHGFNHKVVAIEHTGAPVLSVCFFADRFDNLALSAGIFARACVTKA